MMNSLRAVSASFSLVILFAVLSLTGCGEDPPPTIIGPEIITATVTVSKRDSRLGANLHAKVSGGAQETFDSLTAIEQDLTAFEAVITAGGAFDDASGSSATGINRVEQTSSLSARNAPELITRFQASGSIAGSCSASSVVSQNITARSSGRNSFELDFVPVAGTVEIRISGNYSLEDENSFFWLRLNGRDSAGLLLDVEYDHLNPSAPFDYSFVLPQGERFEFEVSVSTSTVSYAEDGGSASTSGSATFEVNVKFVATAALTRTAGSGFSKDRTEYASLKNRQSKNSQPLRWVEMSRLLF